MAAARSRIATIVAALALVVAACIGSDHGSARAAVGQATGPLIGSPLAGAAILAADGMAPGDVRTGYISVTNIGDISGSFALGSAGLTDTPLSRELDLDVQDVTPGRPATRVYSGKLASLSSVALGDMAQGEAHRYRFSVSLPADADNSYQGASSAVTFMWSATGEEPAIDQPPSTTTPGVDQARPRHHGGGSDQGDDRRHRRQARSEPHRSPAPEGHERQGQRDGRLQQPLPGEPERHRRRRVDQGQAQARAAHAGQAHAGDHPHHAPGTRAARARGRAPGHGPAQHEGEGRQARGHGATHPARHARVAVASRTRPAGRAGPAGTIHTVQDGFRTPTHMPSALIDVCPLSELPPGAARIVEWEDLEIGVFNCNGEILAIEDRCSHDNGTLAEGEFDPATCTVECPRHGSLFDLHTGKPTTLPAYVPVDTFPVVVENDLVKVEVE